jgi:GTPase Era involved in 16S rRNA processing/uncharacterized protein YdbL (DUF1318 family)
MTTNTNPEQGFSFIDLRKVEFTLVTGLSRMRDYADRLELAELSGQIGEVLESVERRSFSIAVVGEFKRGKSTFINALLGKEILPADVAPTTATLNRVTYGMTPRVQVFFKDESGQPGAPTEVGIEQLGEFVTKQSEAASQVAEAVVYYPIPYCENNVSIIDTPGLNDDEAMTRVTLGVLPKVDAAIFVVMANAPFSRFEGDFLNNLLSHALGGIFFVVTAIDRIRKPEERQKILNLIHERIETAVTRRAEEQFGKDSEEYRLYLRRFGQPRVFGLSGYDALEARVGNDLELLEASGFKAFEGALSRFLTEERGAVALRALAERVVSLGEKLLRTLELQRGAAQLRVQDFDRAAAEMEAGLEALRRQGELVLGEIDAAAGRAAARAHPYVYYLGQEMVKAAHGAIDQAPISGGDLNKATIDAVGAFGRKMFSTVRGQLAGAPVADARGAEPDTAFTQLARQINAATARVLAFAGEGINREVQQELEAEVARLREFAAAIDRALSAAEGRFAAPGAPRQAGRSVSGEGMAENLTVVTELGVWAGSQEMGVNSAALGSLTSLGRSVGEQMRGFLTVFSNDSATRQPHADRVQIFKEGYKKAVADQIMADLMARRPDQQVYGAITATFARLRARVGQELDEALARHQQTLDQLRRQRERSELLTERELGDLDGMQRDLRGLLATTYQLSDQLATIMERFA